jgi:hypothetical protein
MSHTETQQQTTTTTTTVVVYSLLLRAFVLVLMHVFIVYTET